MMKVVRFIAIMLLLAVACHFSADQKLWQVLKEDQEVSGGEIAEGLDVQQEEQEERVIDPSKPMIALTFDDGPGEYTDELLDLLEKYDAKATFFLTGSQVNKHPKVIRRMAEMGCEIGNHTEQHKDLSKLKKKDIRAQIDKTNEKIKKITGKSTKLMRPPYGAVNSKVKEVAKYPLIHWSIDTYDWKKKDAKKITKYIKNEAEDGDIVLLHDIHDFTVESMEKVIPYLIKQGYQLVTVSELAEARGVKLKDGKQYYEFKK